MLDAIFLDVDGTLTGHATKPVDRHIKKYLATLQKRGTKVGIATSHAFEEPLTQRFSEYYGFDFMLLENGSVIYTKHSRGGYTRLREYARRQAGKAKHLQHLKKHFLSAAVQVKTADPLMTANGFYQVYSARGMLLRVRFSEASFVIRPVSESENIMPLIEELRETVRRNGWEVAFIEPGPTFVGIGVAHKGDAVKFLAKYLKCSLENSCAIGDAENDVEMLSLVGLPACPADATEQVRHVVDKKGGIVASRNEHIGVREILSRIAGTVR